MPFLLLLPTLLQSILGAMAVVEQLKVPGTEKKKIVLTAVQAAAPAITLLPASTQQNIKDEAPKVAQTAAAVGGLIDALHGIAKANNLYPEIQKSLVVAADVAGGLQAAAEALAPSVGD